MIDAYRDIMFPPSWQAWVIHVAVALAQAVGNAWLHRVDRERERPF